MVTEIVGLVVMIVVFVIGFFCGKLAKDSETTERLRKRGYYIKKTPRYYSDDDYQFIYNGFDHNLKSVKYVGEMFDSYDDAVANADAHYYKRMTGNSDKAPII